MILMLALKTLQPSCQTFIFVLPIIYEMGYLCVMHEDYYCVVKQTSEIWPEQNRRNRNLRAAEALEMLVAVTMCLSWPWQVFSMSTFWMLQGVATVWIDLVAFVMDACFDVEVTGPLQWAVGMRIGAEMACGRLFGSPPLRDGRNA